MRLNLPAMSLMGVEVRGSNSFVFSGEDGDPILLELVSSGFKVVGDFGEAGGIPLVDNSPLADAVVLSDFAVRLPPFSVVILIAAGIVLLARSASCVVSVVVVVSHFTGGVSRAVVTEYGVE
jgi:hypothetical protein